MDVTVDSRWHNMRLKTENDSVVNFPAPLKRVQLQCDRKYSVGHIRSFSLKLNPFLLCAAIDAEVSAIPDERAILVDQYQILNRQLFAGDNDVKLLRNDPTRLNLPLRAGVGTIDTEANCQRIRR